MADTKPMPVAQLRRLMEQPAADREPYGEGERLRARYICRVHRLLRTRRVEGPRA